MPGKARKTPGTPRLSQDRKNPGIYRGSTRMFQTVSNIRERTRIELELPGTPRIYYGDPRTTHGLPRIKPESPGSAVRGVPSPDPGKCDCGFSYASRGLRLGSLMFNLQILFLRVAVIGGLKQEEARLADYRKKLTFVRRIAQHQRQWMIGIRGTVA